MTQQLRVAQLSRIPGPDAALYITTADGQGDRILRLAPSGGRCAA